ncbi:MAG: hypothetical protein ACM3H9_02490 [Rhodospirillaceae bacterium]
MAKTPAAKKTTSRAKPRTATLRVQVQHDVDKALAQAGIPSAIDSDGWRWMQDPTGKGLIGVVAITGQREDLSLRVVAPIMPLPTGQAALLRVLRRIAEMNYEIPGHSRLAIDSRTVWAVVAHNVGDIGADDVPNCIFDCVWLSQAAADWLKGTKPKKVTKKR